MAQIAAVKASIAVSGVVQGVGFRPFVLKLAREHGLTGTVRNAAGQVIIEAFGPRGRIERLIRDIDSRRPAESSICALRQRLEPVSLGTDIPREFTIAESGGEGAGPAMPSPDLATCPDCLRELFAPGDPRERNPFISCTHCGPRFSVMRRLPYDRDTTAMDRFPMCDLCRAQYADVADRRHHAQTVCCNACGPTLRYVGRGERAEKQAALDLAVTALRAGGIVAVKGLGGYHFACSPCDREAVRALRELKGREHKPFAVMFENLDSLREHCAVSPEEQALLESPARPIVLLQRKPSAIAGEVYSTSSDLGAFLPYTPLQHLLLRETGPLVMTSANASSQPILYEDDAVTRFFEGHTALAGVLTHDRPILRPLDDSVVAVAAGGTLFHRRARGYVPLAMQVDVDGPPLVACGAQEKNVLALAKGGYVYLSAEVGDLDAAEAEALYRRTVSDMQAVLQISPELAVCDMHPGYFSTAYARSTGLPVTEVQHHHAHIASVMAEHALRGPVLGVAFDGTGYGPDGSVWGGEFLIATPADFTRAGHLKALSMQGGDPSVRQGWKSAACVLHDAGISCEDPRGALVQKALAGGIDTHRSSSAGRLFDAVSAMLGICRQSSYGGQGAIELENAAVRCVERGGKSPSALPFDIGEQNGELIADFAPAIRAIHSARAAGEEPDRLAWRFHRTVAEVVNQVCVRLAQKHGLGTVCLGGGVFHNRLLLQQITPALRRAGLAVYRNNKVPPGDGGIALGQALAGLAIAQKNRR